LTVIVTVALLVSAESDAVNCSTYDPETEKLAVVLSKFGFPNVTVPGPLNFDHVFVNVLPVGNPSSVAVPLRVAVAGSVIVWLDPALTVGA
jgi:hypothetical protein